MSDNPLIEGFLKIHEAGGVGGGMSGTKFSKVANYAPAVGAGVRGAVDNATLGAGKYVRAAADYAVKNLGSVAGINEPTTFNKELEQEREKDTAAQQNQPAAWDVGDKAATAAGVATGIGGVAKTIAGAVAKKAAREVAKSAAKTSKDFELGVGRLDLFPDEAVSSMRPPAQPSSTLKLTQQMRVQSTPASQAAPVSQTPLNLTQQMRVPGTRKVIPFRNTRLTTEEQNEPSKGNTEMSTNPFIKGFFDIEEARAKNTNIFDESKKLTAAQKKNLDKNDNDKIDAEDFKMLRKEEAIEEAKKPKPGHNAMVMARNVSKVLNAAEQRKKQEKDEKPIEPKDQKVGNAKITKEGAYYDRDTDMYLSNDEYAALNNDYSGMSMNRESAGQMQEGAWRHAEMNNASKKAHADAEEKIKKSSSFTSDTLKDINDKLGNTKITKEGEEFKKRQSVAGLKKMIDDHDARAKTTTSPLKKEHHRKMSQQLRDQLADIKEEVEFSEEEMNFINSVMEAMPVAPTSETDSPNPTPKKKAEGSRAKGSMAD